MALNVEVVGSTTFKDFPQKSSCDSETGGCSGSANAICSRLEIADHVISGENAGTFRDYYVVNLQVAGLSSFRESRN